VVGSVINGAIDPTLIDLILPVRGRARTEFLARTLLAERYAASGARQRTLTKGPGRDSSGGVTIRPRRYATLLSLLKHQGVRSDLLRSTRYGWSLRAVEVVGGLAWTQWLITLTGESPTPSLDGPEQARPISIAKRSGHAAERRSAPPASASGMAAAPE
jgi:hypothetical protein